MISGGARLEKKEEGEDRAPARHLRFMRKTRSRAQNGDRLQGGAQVFQGRLGPTYVYLSYLGSILDTVSKDREDTANLHL